MDAGLALAFVREHGVVLASAKGRAPTLADAIAGEPIKGSWWGHPKGRQVFAVLERVYASDEVLVCRLVDGKVTLVHCRLWPALAAAAAGFPDTFVPSRLCKVTQVHTAGGRHENRETAFPDWVPADILAQAKAIAAADALAELLPFVTNPRKRPD